MTDWTTIVLTGFFTGIGVETAKIVHEIYIAKKFRETADRLNETAKKISESKVVRP